MEMLKPVEWHEIILDGSEKIFNIIILSLLCKLGLFELFMLLHRNDENIFRKRSRWKENSIIFFSFMLEIAGHEERSFFMFPFFFDN